MIKSNKLNLESKFDNDNISMNSHCWPNTFPSTGSKSA